MQVFLEGSYSFCVGFDENVFFLFETIDFLMHEFLIELIFFEYVVLDVHVLLFDLIFGLHFHFQLSLNIGQYLFALSFVLLKLLFQ